MTTSFALLVRGDVVNSFRANAVGTLLAGFCLALIPWAVASFAARRPLVVRAIEPALLRVIFVFLTLLLLRWGIVLGWSWWGRRG
jgi:hypothetical protein